MLSWCHLLKAATIHTALGARSWHIVQNRSTVIFEGPKYCMPSGTRAFLLCLCSQQFNPQVALCSKSGVADLWRPTQSCLSCFHAGHMIKTTDSNSDGWHYWALCMQLNVKSCVCVVSFDPKFWETTTNLLGTSEVYCSREPRRPYDLEAFFNIQLGRDEDNHNLSTRWAILSLFLILCHRQLPWACRPSLVWCMPVRGNFAEHQETLFSVFSTSFWRRKQLLLRNQNRLQFGSHSVHPLPQPQINMTECGPGQINILLLWNHYKSHSSLSHLFF